MLSIRPAAVHDVPLLLNFSREFAEYERQSGAVVINEETLTRDGFGTRPKFRSLIAEWEAQAVGYALFFDIYSTLKGGGIFLEDLFVRETFRGRGIGRALLSQVARQIEGDRCGEQHHGSLDRCGAMGVKHSGSNNRCIPKTTDS